MMVKGFEVWKVAVRLLPKRFDTTKTRCGRSSVGSPARTARLSAQLYVPKRAPANNADKALGSSVSAAQVRMGERSPGHSGAG
jgi:hypothetical protein